MKRALLLLALLAVPAAAMAGEQVYRLGELASSAATIEDTRQWTLPELARSGFNEGSNLIVDARFGTPADMPELGRKLVEGKPNAILTFGGEALDAAHAATKTVPIVSFGPDLAALGLAESFAHPGGNITGLAIFATELDGKRLDLLHEAVPAARRMAALFVPSAPTRDVTEREMRAVAKQDGLDLLVFDATGPDYAEAFAAMRASGAQALVVTANPYLYRSAVTIAQLALAASLPTVCEWPEMARSGCMLGYGPRLVALRRRVGDYIARIFAGANPGDLPLEQPTRFELVVNLQTAKALGLTIPPLVLARADEVIE